MQVRLIQIDGSLPNLALMKLAHWHRARGDRVDWSRSISPDLFDPEYDRVYASAIFSYSADKVERARKFWPGLIVGGTGSASNQTVEEVIGADEYEHYDYTDYPAFRSSIGFTQRGCRLKCKFCVVPKKEGKPRSVNTIWDIFRGDPWPRCLHLLDNDFFGQDVWRERIAEIRDGGFKVSFNQGINVRFITDEAAEALASIEYRDDQFQHRRIYTAWDNRKDEKIFFRGIDMLERAGIPGKHVMAYMLIGYDPHETEDARLDRFHKMTKRGILPFPMVYDRSRKDLKHFQRWAVTGLYRAVPWEDYQGYLKHRSPLAVGNLFEDKCVSLAEHPGNEPDNAEVKT